MELPPFMALSNVLLRNASPGLKLIRLFDGRGLYVEVAPGGGKWWRLKYRFAGKEKRLSLGVYPDVSLKDARERRDVKASSNLTEADRLDVRAQVATAANVSAGNVSAVKKLLEKAVPEVLEALRESELSIHRARSWLEGPGKQLDQLSLYQNRRVIDRKSQRCRVVM